MTAAQGTGLTGEEREFFVRCGISPSHMQKWRDAAVVAALTAAAEAIEGGEVVADRVRWRDGTQFIAVADAANIVRAQIEAAQ